MCMSYDTLNVLQKAMHGKVRQYNQIIGGTWQNYALPQAVQFNLAMSHLASNSQGPR